MRLPAGLVAMPPWATLPMVAMLITLLAGSQVYSAQLDQEHRRTGVHRVEAVLLQASGSPAVSVPWGSAGERVAGNGLRVQIAWDGQDGVRHVGAAPVPPNRPAGTHISVWADSSGVITRAQPGRGKALLTAALAGGACAAAMLLGVCGARAARRVRSARRAASEIDREWERVAPAWPGRRS
ncbi:Rv1733c family protein [Actinomadura scrupuli]|uniref:Rv1733c family protein n=1 Tax=Actinomadura scrupuli TaxID=559629 RepID=UPI003D9792BC